MSELAHQFEDALSLDSAASHAALAEIAFAAADVFGGMITAYHGGGAMPATEALRQRINELTSAPAAKKLGRKKKSAEAVSQSGKDWTETEKRALAEAQAAGLAIYDIAVKIDPHCTMPIAARQLIQNAISRIGNVLVARPDAKSPAASKQVEFVVASSQTEEQIAAKSRIPTITGEVSITLIAAASPSKSSAITAPAAVPQSPASAPEASAAPASPAPAPVEPARVEAQAAAPESAPQAMMENILRVEAGRIDNVLNLVGELIIGKSMFQQALNEFGKRYPKELLRGKFADVMAFQARVLNDLQRSVMKLSLIHI